MVVECHVVSDDKGIRHMCLRHMCTCFFLGGAGLGGVRLR